MTPAQVLEDLKSKIPISSSISDALATFISHYEETDVEGCEKANDTDSLMMEWGGPYSWDPSFSVSLTRQFSFDDEDGDYVGMLHLHMYCRYASNEVKFGGGSEYFYGTDVSEFKKEVLSLKIVEIVRELEMESLEFELENV